MASITHGSTTINLSDDCLWEDEFTWNPVEQAVARTLTGAMIVETSQVIGGRPITLTPPDDEGAWTKYEDLLKLNQLAATPGLVMELTFRGVTYSVMFRHHENDPVSAKPVVFYRDPGVNDPYLVTIKLMEI